MVASLSVPILPGLRKFHLERSIPRFGKRLLILKTNVNRDYSLRLAMLHGGGKMQKQHFRKEAINLLGNSNGIFRHIPLGILLLEIRRNTSYFLVSSLFN
jgi:hypothetical protein